MKAAIFAGQGAQRPGMGLDLFPHVPRLVREADDFLGYSIENVCRDDAGQLADTRFTQPALYVVQCASFVTHHSDGEFACFMGHSVGEYAALFASGMLSFLDGLRLVAARGRIMAESNGGAMLAFIGSSRDDVEQLIHRERATSDVYIANENTPTQTVVSGPADQIDTLAHVASASGFFVRPLRVSGAFHSPHMRKASYEFYNEVKNVRFHAPTAPVISSCNAKPYTDASPAVLLSDQISTSIRWTDTVATAMQLGITEFVEIGVGRTLTNITREAVAHA